MKRAVFYMFAAAVILLLAVGAYSRQDSRRLPQNAEIEKIEHELDRLSQRAEQMAARLELIKAAVPEEEKSRLRATMRTLSVVTGK